MPERSWWERTFGVSNSSLLNVKTDLSTDTGEMPVVTDDVVDSAILPEKAVEAARELLYFYV